jgi:predicted phage tail protein
MGLAALGSKTAVVAPMMFGMGVSMAMGGVVQLLSPQQRGLSTRDSPDNGASYSFNGPVNTSAQGNPVPVLYGRMIVGSAVISAGIYAEDQV